MEETKISANLSSCVILSELASEEPALDSDRGISFQVATTAITAKGHY